MHWQLRLVRARDRDLEAGAASEIAELLAAAAAGPSPSDRHGDLSLMTQIVARRVRALPGTLCFLEYALT